MAETRAPSPRYTWDGPIPNIRITDDDIEILLFGAHNRVFGSDDIYALFPDRNREMLSKRLNKLWKARYLARPGKRREWFKQETSRNLESPYVTPSMLKEYQTVMPANVGSGSPHLALALDLNGAKLLNDLFNLGLKPERLAQKNAEISLQSIEHHLRTSRFMRMVQISIRNRPGLRLVTFHEILESFAPSATKKASQPERFRTPVVWNNKKSEAGIMPDKIFGIEYTNPKTGKRFFHPYFLEIDNGTETIEPGVRRQRAADFLTKPSILQKQVIYQSARKHGAHKQHFGIDRFYVLMVTTTPNRASEMIARTFEPHLRPRPFSGRSRLAWHTDWQTIADHNDDPLALPWLDNLAKEAFLDRVKFESDERRTLFPTRAAD